MLALVVADAPHADLHEFLPLFSVADLVIAADGGTRHVLHYGITPHVIIGDLDSVDLQTLAIMQERGVEIVRYSAQKDETDLELAVLLAIERGATEIRILAALGGRPDMHLANHLLLAHHGLHACHIAMLDHGWEIRMIHTLLRLQGNLGQRVSLLPLGDVEGISTTGLRYALHDESLLGDAVRGVSNEFAATNAEIHVRSGRLLIFIER